MIFKKHALSTIQIREYDYSVSEKKDDDGNPYYSRLVKWYPWGCAITIKRDCIYYTIIAIGRFNIRTGAVFGSNDSQVHMPMKWYKSMSKELVDG
jgi:ribosomal protein L21E